MALAAIVYTHLFLYLPTLTKSRFPPPTLSRPSAEMYSTSQLLHLFLCVHEKAHYSPSLYVDAPRVAKQDGILEASVRRLII